MKILIGGTGRSGTSMLAKMFIDLGSNAFHMNSGYINNDISAGCEIGLHECISFLGADISGVAKTPWLYEICQLDEFNSQNIDLIIIPVRDPRIASMSRLINEIKAFCFNSELAVFDQSFGRVDAGNHYFLDGIESMRNLSASLAYLLHQCLVKGIKVSFVPFPEIGDHGIARSWAKSIEPYINSLGIDSSQIVGWINANFDSSKTLDTHDQSFNHPLEEYIDFISKSANALSSSTAFIYAHQKYLKQHDEKLTNLAQELDQAKEGFHQTSVEAEQAKAEAQQAQAELQQAKAEAQQAKAEAQQAKAEAELHQNLLSEVTSSRCWILTRPVRKILDKLK